MLMGIEDWAILFAKIAWCGDAEVCSSVPTRLDFVGLFPSLLWILPMFTNAWSSGHLAIYMYAFG